jgi:hypothetical protein
MKYPDSWETLAMVFGIAYIVAMIALVVVST